MLPNSWRLEEGAFSAFLVSGLSVVTVVVTAIGIGVGVSVDKQKIQLVADSTALILSETSRGLIAGFSCEKAEQYAKTFDIDLDSCRIVSSVASVRLTKWFGTFRLEAKASAGPM